MKSRKINRKGITLVELIAVITILGILSTIGVVSISSILVESKRNECESIKENLISATKEYLVDNRFNLSPPLTVQTLMNGNYFSKKVTNPFTGDESTTFGSQIITYSMTTDLAVSGVTVSFIDCENRVFPN